MTESQFLGMLLNVLAILATGAGAAIYVHKQVGDVGKKWAEHFATLSQKVDKKTEALDRKLDEHSRKVEERWGKLTETIDKTYQRIPICGLIHENLTRRIESLEENAE